MLSYTAYKVIHVFGIVMMFVALGGACASAGASGRIPKIIGALHGVGALISLVAGFGLLATMSMGQTFPMWVLVKFVIWLVLAASYIVPRRKPAWGGPMLIALPFVALLAAYLAIYKPF